MGINALQFNQYNNINLQPGLNLDSGTETTSGIYRLTSAVFATVAIPIANLFVAGDFTFSVTQNATGRVLFSTITQGVAVDPLLLVSTLAQALNPLYNVSFAAGNMTITAKTPGAAGTFNIVTPAGSSASNAPTDPLPLLPGRIVVGENTPYTGLQSSFNINVVYPTTINATTQTLGGLYITGFGDIVNVAPTPYDNSGDANRVFVGNVVELYTKANALVLQSITAIGTTAPLFVETSVANNGRDTGKVTATATASTIALPDSRLQVLQGTASANGLIIVKLT